MAVPQHRKRLGQNIRAARKRAGMSQEKLAEKAELHPVYVGGIERGEHNVSIDSLKRVADSLHVTILDLLSGV